MTEARTIPHYASCAECVSDDGAHSWAQHLACLSLGPDRVEFEIVFDRPVLNDARFGPALWPGPLPMTLENTVEYVRSEFGAEVLWMRRVR